MTERSRRSFESLPVSARVRTLQESAQQALDADETAALVAQLFAVYPSFDSSDLRRLSAAFLAKAAGQDPEPVVAQLQKAPRAHLPDSAAALLLEWTNAVAAEAGALPALVDVQAQLLAKIADTNRRLRLRESAIRQTETALGAIAAKHGADAYVAYLRDNKTVPALLLFGTLAAGARDVSAAFPAVEAAVRDAMPLFTAAFTSAVLAAKQPPPLRMLQALQPVFAIMPQASLDELVPALARAMLRAPEVVLTGPLPALVDGARGLDLAGLVEALQASLLANLGSVNVALREKCAAQFAKLLARAPVPAVVTAVATAAKKATKAEQRVLFVEILAAATSATAPSEVKSVVLDTLALLAPKESTETAVAAIAPPIVALLPDTAPIVLKGLGDQRWRLRREWILACAFTNTDLSGLQPAFEEILKAVLANPTAAISNKYIGAGYAAVALLAGSANTDDASSLFEAKIFDRLTAEDAMVAAKAARVFATDASARCAAHLAASISREHVKERLYTLQQLGELYVARPELGPAMVAQLEENAGRYAGVRECLSVFARPVAGADASLVALVTLAHLVPPSKGWIGLCLGAGVDPGALAVKYRQELLAKVWAAAGAGSGASESAESAAGPAWRRAACAALATLTFVAPALAADVAEFLRTTLEPIAVDADEAVIYATPAGELAMTRQVLKKKDAPARGRDKSVETWEQELRRELAAKNGGKLSKEDQQVVAEQQAVRERLAAAMARYELAFSVVDALSTANVDNGIETWFPAAVSALLELATHTSLASEPAAACLRGLSRNLSPRLEAKRALAGLAMCHVFRLPGGSASAVVNALYKASDAASQVPLNRTTTAYLLPMLTRLVETTAPKGAISEPEEEQLMLVLSVLARQADELRELPRPRLVVALLALLSRLRDKAKDIKECLLRVAQGVVFDDVELSAVLAAAVDRTPYVRTAALEILDQEVDLTAKGYAPEILIARFGDDTAVASTIYEESEMRLPDNATLTLEPFLGYEVRPAVARAISAVVLEQPASLQLTLDTLYSVYRRTLEPPAPEKDEFGIEIKKPFKDPWETRSGVLQALHLLVPALEAAQVLEMADFVTAVAGDAHASVDAEAQALGARLVAVHGAAQVDELLQRFEHLVAHPGERAQQHAQIRQAHVVLYGLEAQHLAANDPRLPQIVAQLLEALATPSERVQASVSDALAALARKLPDPAKEFEQLLAGLGSAAGDTSARRGAAYGLGGLVKGLGLASLSDYGVIRAIQDGSDDRKEAARREGAQLAVEALARSLGRLFEPYALEILPLVFAGLGDMNNLVRDAAAAGARALMKHTTGYGIKKTIPMTLERLDQTAWRGKKGAVELLGTMAYLDPAQLSASLSTIVPEIVGVLNDTHKEVRASAKGALRTFGDVIENPEIKALVPQLLEAIGDPTKHTDAALDALLATKFAHYIDTPSLALVIHVLQRGLRDRSANTKRRSCQIVGNMSILTDGTDLVPYLPDIMPDLQVAMTDPVPATCATACKALGALVEKLGEDQFPRVIPDMLATLRDPAKVGDRWGTAQGLAEVAHGLGIAKLEEILPVVVRSCASPQPHVRQGFVLLLLFLPASFGQSFTPYLSQIVPPVLQCLADSVDDVREQALKAGRLLVREYAAKAVDLLLPELETGLADPSWRIRLSSVELTGDLMFRLAGVARNAAIEEAGLGTAGQQALVESLGQARRDRILAALFVCRADVAIQVRNSALEVWMALVANTPRTVKEILPLLTQMIVKRLAAAGELQTNAARALGELVRRVSGALVQLLPTLEKLALDPDARQGICVGLVELLSSTPVDVLQEHERQLTQLIRGCLTDPSVAVREAASQAFEALQQSLGEVGGDLLPELVAQMEQGDEGALAALKEMMATSAALVFPVLVPKLLEPPLTAFKAESLADVCESADEVLFSQLEAIVDALLAAELDSSDAGESAAAALDRILSVSLPEVHLLEQLKEATAARQQAVLAHVAAQIPQQTLQWPDEWVSASILALEDSVSAPGAVALLQALAGSLSKDQLARLAAPADKALGMTSVPLPGLEVPKAVSAVLPFFLQALAVGGNSDKKVAALAISKIAERTDAASLKPAVTQMVGPLIRMAGERGAPDVKATIVRTLHDLLQRIAAFLKPFLPQLQRTFVKALADSDAQLGEAAAQALSALIPLQPRVDPLCKELVAGVSTAATPAVRSAMLQALLELVREAGDRLSDASRASVLELVDSLDIPEQDHRQLALVATITAVLLGLLGQPEHVRQLLAAPGPLAVLAANAVLIYAKALVTPELAAFLSASAANSDAMVSENAVAGLAKYLLITDDAAPLQVVVESIQKNDSRSVDTRRLALMALAAVGRHKRHYLTDEVIDSLILPLFASVRETTIPVKLAAERAFLDVFDFVAQDTAFFDAWYKGAVDRGAVPQQNQRSITEYVRRVAMRHAASRKERGDMEDPEEQELWRVLS